MFGIKCYTGITGFGGFCYLEGFGLKNIVWHLSSVLKRNIGAIGSWLGWEVITKGFIAFHLQVFLAKFVWARMCFGFLEGASCISSLLKWTLVSFCCPNLYHYQNCLNILGLIHLLMNKLRMPLLNCFQSCPTVLSCCFQNQCCPQQCGSFDHKYSGQQLHMLLPYTTLWLVHQSVPYTT